MESQPGQKVSLPSGQMAKLALLVGCWSIVDRTADETSADSTRGSCIVRGGPGGLSVILDEVVEASGRTYIVHGILSWESALDCYRFVLADSRVSGLHFLSGSWRGTDLHFRSVPESGTDGLWRRVALSEIEPEAFTMTIDCSEAAEPPERIVHRYARKIGPHTE